MSAIQIDEEFMEGVRGLESFSKLLIKKTSTDLLVTGSTHKVDLAAGSTRYPILWSIRRSYTWKISCLLLLFFVVVVFCCLLFLFFVVVVFCCCFLLLLFFVVVFCCFLLLLFFVVVVFCCCCFFVVVCYCFLLLFFVVVVSDRIRVL